MSGVQFTCIKLTFFQICCLACLTKVGFTDALTYTHTHTAHSDPWCCFSCPSPVDQSVASVASVYESSNIVDDDVTLLFGALDGSLVVRPTVPTPPSDCARRGMDARLETWFGSLARENPLEVVVVLDVRQRLSSVGGELYAELSAGVVAVAESLTIRDRVSGI